MKKKRTISDPTSVSAEEQEFKNEPHAKETEEKKGRYEDYKQVTIYVPNPILDGLDSYLRGKPAFSKRKRSQFIISLIGDFLDKLNTGTKD